MSRELLARSRLGLVGAAVLGIFVLLGGCSDKRDTQSTSRKLDASPVSGANVGYAASGWKTGDATSWEEHMRTRTQQGQNEYNRTQAASK
jgi:hypothetical protein